MLKRHQVLLSDWQTEYIRHIAERYDVSFSETIRGTLCMGFIYAISLVYPEYKNKVSKKDVLKIVSEAINPVNEVEIHKFVSTLYFEGRKATEYALGKAKEKVI